ncbi:hypothetical protein [Paenibacillus sp. GYB003]|uniref:hypothetical protein n=1 Tax=Paenibacillus sp. GYB003 TaxID=2994392 RepID=UPI002F96E4D7
MPEHSVPGELSRRNRAPAKPKRPKAERRVAAQGDVVLFGIALSYLLLGVLKAADIVAVDTPVIASFSLAGMCFALSDLLKLGIRAEPAAFRLFCRLFYFVFLLASSLCLVVVPLSYAYIGWLGAIIVPLGDMSALTGMGVIIGVIVINNLLLRRKPAADKSPSAPGEHNDVPL